MRDLISAFSNPVSGFPSPFGRRRSAWSPTSLFANGEAGALYLPGPDTCFQDAAGTIPAGNGDPVGHLADLSGNGNHATQATSAARPTLTQDVSGNWYLDFDGVDDYLTATISDYATATEAAYYAAYSTPAAQTPDGEQPYLATFSTDFWVLGASGYLTDDTLTISSNHPVNSARVGATTYTRGAGEVDVLTIRTSTTGVSARSLGADITFDQGKSASTSSDWSPSNMIDAPAVVDIGAFPASTAWSDLVLYGLIIRADEADITTEGKVESYLANISGATL